MTGANHSRLGPAPRPARRPHVSLPEGWELVEVSGPYPFATRALLRRPDGATVEWTSRAHRKRLGQRPHALTSWIAGFFMIGASCFALGSCPLFFDRVGADVASGVFFLGSIFFTTAAYLQFYETMNAPPGPAGGVRRRRWLSLEPTRIDWWACGVQFVGTLFFNLSTFSATLSSLTEEQTRRLVWAPDAFGSIAFLVASALAFAEVGHHWVPLRHRTLSWWIAALNLLGSLAFSASAVGARLLPTTGEPANVTLVNAGTFVGAVCFFAGAYLLFPESARRTETAGRRRRHG